MNSNNPWFKRGGDHNNGLDAGVLAFGNENGHAESWHSFRVVLRVLFLRKFKNNQKE